MKKAFTLIELLVVIAIIAILAAMLMPALTRAKEEAQKARCSANVHNLGLGWAMFRKDFDGNWSREQCDGWDLYPESIADIGGFGYVDDIGVYLCPSLDSSSPREPELIVWYTEAGVDVADTTVRYTGEIHGTSYFADEARIPREPLEQRAVLADGIEMVTMYGREPANHSDANGRATGANVLFVDMAVQWEPVYREEHTWTLEVQGTWGGDGTWPAEPNSYGYTTGEDWYPHATAGTWRRFGYIQNHRLLYPDEGEWGIGGGAGVGEDDLENSLYSDDAGIGQGSYDVDDIYYADCTTEEYGDAARWGFVSFGKGARCFNPGTSKNERDCSLAGGHIWYWRGAYYDFGVVPEEYAGYTWGWPDEMTMGY